MRRAARCLAYLFDAVLETVRVPRSQIKPLGAAGRHWSFAIVTIPVLDLASSLDLDVKQGARPDIACLVIALIGGQRVGIEIDRPGERLDLMLKPVEGLLAGMTRHFRAPAFWAMAAC